ncbi:hypothetical protein LAY57_03090 [Argonema antarcticum A004/B2]|nr:hypothetical protein [Argonema antarcticum A004/B2]
MPQVKTIVTSVSGVGFQQSPINVAKVAWKQLNWKKIEKAIYIPNWLDTQTTL